MGQESERLSQIVNVIVTDSPKIDFFIRKFQSAGSINLPVFVQQVSDRVKNNSSLPFQNCSEKSNRLAADSLEQFMVFIDKHYRNPIHSLPTIEQEFFVIFEDVKENFYSIISKAIVFEGTVLNAADAFQKQINRFEDAFKSAQESVNIISGLKNNLESQVGNLTEKAASYEISKHTKIYQSDIRRQFWVSLFYAIAAFIFFLLSVFFLLIFTFDFSVLFLDDIKNKDSFSNFLGQILKLHTQDKYILITSKFVSVGMFLGVSIWFGRLFKASRHIAETTRHRMNSIKSFETFINAASPAVKDEILHKTTEAIFAHTSTGYLPNQGNDSDLRAMEVVNNLTK